MPCTVVSVFKREDTNRVWHTQAFNKKSVNRDFIKESMRVGLLGDRRTETQIDDFTLRIEAVWDSREEYETFMAIPAVKAHFDFIALYNMNMGITAEPKQFIET